MRKITPFNVVDGIYFKQECANETGSIKDRFIMYWLDHMERNGKLKKGDTIIEASSGNTGISLSYFGSKRGYNVKIVMPQNMSIERKNLIKNNGSELLECDAGDFALAASIRDNKILKYGFHSPLQFSNQLNIDAHYWTTGLEIISQFNSINPSKSIDVFVSGVGTGGTLIGVAKRLREFFPCVKIVAVEPEESAVMSSRNAAVHKIQGIGDGFIPQIVKGTGKNGLHELIDEVALVHSEEAIQKAKELAQKGHYVGISSGANFAVSQKYSQEGKNVVTVFADGASKYISMGLKVNENIEKPCEDLCRI